MDKIRIVGRQKLSGKVPVSGAKNAALPAMAASLLTSDSLRLSNLPDVWDVGTMRRLLAELGVRVGGPDDGELRLECPGLTSHEAPYELVKTMRASVLVLGPLLARFGRARVSLPGGCAIGARPIDMHLNALERLGANARLEHGFVESTCDGLTGAEIHFGNVTVTGTENVMMAATLAKGETVLSNCAREPEIVDLAELLVSMGAQIEGAGSSCIRVQGVERLHGAQHRIVPDRIEAGTYMIAAAMAGGEVEITNCRTDHLDCLLETLRNCEVATEVRETTVRVEGIGARALSPVSITTQPYPGFATDMQAQLMVLLTRAQGDSDIVETIFENRFMHVAELLRMGAHISVNDHRATVHGPSELSGAKVMATDLRASACLVLAGLAARDETVIDRVYHLDRGYEDLVEKLSNLGAEIERVR